MEEKSAQKRLFLIIGITCILLFGSLFLVYMTMPKPAPIAEKKTSPAPTLYPTKSPPVKRNITSIDELHEIIREIIDYADAQNYADPDIDVLSNDGEYATATLAEGAQGSTTKLFLVKRDKTWIIVHNGNDLPSCKEFLPTRTKYTLPPSFLQCAEE